MNIGYLTLHICNESGYPLAQAMIRIFQKEQQIVYETFAISDECGKSMSISLPCIDKHYSILNNQNHCPYTQYNVEVHADGYDAQLIKNVAIFAEEHSILPITLQPSQSTASLLNTHVLHDHYLYQQYKSYRPHIPFQQKIAFTKQIPFFVRVHLDLPNKDAQTISIPFIEYIKNVASSMLFPTWQPQALKVSIIAITSTLLHYLFSQYYQNKGYTFTITNSQQDPLVYIHHRNIYTTIDLIVEEVFNQYYVNNQSELPLLFTFTNQQIEKQNLNFWDIQAAALQGYTFDELLQEFLPKGTCLVISNHLQNLRAYPGIPLKVNQQGMDIEYVKTLLSKLQIYYPILKQKSPNHDFFDENLLETLHAFQQLFHLKISDSIDQSTWYTLAYLAQSLSSTSPPQAVFSTIKIREMQRDLNTIASLFPRIPLVIEDGELKKQTLSAWYIFHYHLSPSNLSIEESLTTLCVSAKQIRKGLFPTLLLPPYPHRLDRIQMRHVSQLLDKIAHVYPQAFKTQKDIIACQTLLGIPPTQHMNEQTWYLMNILAKQLE